MSERPPDATHSLPAATSISFSASVGAWILIVSVALASLGFFYSQGLSNLYGDGLAHSEGARRIFDSLTPGYPEIGSVWLPLFHLLASPLALSDFLWRTGLAGSLISTAAFVLTAGCLFHLAREINSNGAAAFLALAVFLLSPNALYLASTPLTEPLSLLWMVLVVYGLFRFQQGARLRALVGSALAAFLGTLTRYDGWGLLPWATLFVLLAVRGPWPIRLRQAALFAGIAGLGPALWLLHNAYRFGNPLEFYNGPFSAQAIYAHQVATTGFRYPTEGSLFGSARYYMADLRLVIGVWPLELAVLGLVAWAAERRERVRRSMALLFLVPLPFYVYSVADAAVPLYVPTLFPHTYYNLRYGLEMLPAVAILPSFLLSPRLAPQTRYALLAVLLGALLVEAVSAVRAGPRELAVVKEGLLNTPCRSERQQAIIRLLRAQYDGQTVLAAAGKWPCVMPAVGMAFRKTLSETNRKYWNKVRTEPEKWVGWIIRGEGDAVDELMRAYPQAFKGFELLRQETFPGEGSVAIYRRRAPGPRATNGVLNRRHARRGLPVWPCRGAPLWCSRDRVRQTGY